MMDQAKKNKIKSTKTVKKLVADFMTDRKKGISVSMDNDNSDDIDRIYIKFPRNFTDFIGFTLLKERILDKNGFHIAQIMGFMDDKKLWILIVRDRR